MLTAKDIIEMEESVIHQAEPRKRSDTLHAEMTTDISTSSSEWNPALVSRRASVPMEIIIGGNGKPIFTASSSSAVGSPVLTDRQSHGEKEKEKKKTDGRSGSKKRSTSQKKKVTPAATGTQKALKKKDQLEKKNDEDRESSEDSSTSKMTNDMATCFIGVPTRQPKQIEHLPEYEILRKHLLVNVRDAVVQTDLF